MHYSGYELLTFFFIYSFLGWVLEVVFAAASKKRFANRGFLNGPICPIYGGSMVFILVFFEALQNNLFFLFLGSLIVSTILEFLSGMMLERLLGQKWWDYSGYRFNLDGYVCLWFSLFWGVGAVVLVKFVQPLVEVLVRWMPSLAGKIILMVLAFLFLCDFVVTLSVLLKIKRQSRRMKEIAKSMHQLSGRIGNAITRQVQKRMVKAFPHLGKQKNQSELITTETQKGESIALNYGFHKLVWLFFIGAFLGDLVEMVFCRLTVGYWMSRSSVLYGSFSVVWGIGVVLLTILLYRYRHRDSLFIFLFGTIIGGAYEYVCSVFTELVFGTVFWDYSGIPFNLGGRINLLYCFFWGFVSIIWIKLLFPVLNRLIEKVPAKVRLLLSYCFVVFMTANILVSSLALARYSERTSGKEAQTQVEHFLDQRYHDARMERVYPNAKRINIK